MKKKAFSKKTASKVLSTIAFALNLIWKDYLGTFFAILLGAFALFVFLETLGITKMRVRAGLEGIEHFHSINGLMIFLVVAILTKLIVPLLVHEDFVPSLIVVVIFTAILYATYKLWDRTIWRRYKQVAKLAFNIEQKREYNRVTNSVFVLCALISLDGADLMFLLDILVSFTYEIMSVLKVLRSAILKLSSLIQQNWRKDVKKPYVRSDRRGSKSFQDRLWARVYYTRTFLRGLPLLIFAFVGCLPFVIFSYQIELFKMNLGILLGMIVLSTPGLLALLVVHFPWRVGKGQGIRLRKNVLLLSFLPPILLIVANTLFSYLELQAPIPSWWMLCLTAMIGLPLLQGTMCAEQDDYSGTIKWFRILGINACVMIVLVNTYAYWSSSQFSGFLSPTFIFTMCICMFLSSVMYMVFSHALIIQFVEGFKELDHKEVDYWINRILAPGLNVDTFVVAIGLGALQGLLSIWVIALCGPLAVAYNAFLSFAFGFETGALFQNRIDRGYNGALSIAIFQILGCYLSIAAIFISILKDEMHSIVQMLAILGYLLVSSAVWVIPAGTVVALLYARRSKQKNKQKLTPAPDQKI